MLDKLGGGDNMADMKKKENKIKNSYIFLRKRNQLERRGDKVCLTRSPESISSILQRKFKNISTKDMQHSNKYQEFKMIDKKTSCEVIFSISQINFNTYVDVIIVCNNGLKNAIICLEWIDKVLHYTDFTNNYFVITSYDSISKYYCNLIFPQLNEVERTLRQLLLNIYTVNYGPKYYERISNEKVHNKVQDKIRNKIINQEEEKQKEIFIQEYFYFLEYGDINDILFKENKINGKDNQNRNFDSKSDWEKLFNDKIPDNINIEDKINKIRINRNLVAHCNFFNKKDYKECNKLIKELKPFLDEAILQTKEYDFVTKNAENVQKSIIEIQKAFSKTIQTMIQYVDEYNKNSLQPIKDYKQYLSELFSSLTMPNYYVKKIGSIVCGLKQLSNFYVNELNREHEITKLNPHSQNNEESLEINEENTNR